MPNFIEVEEIKGGTRIAWWYPVPDTLDCETAYATFNQDPDKKGKVLSQRPAPSAGKVWSIKNCAVAPPPTPGGGSQTLAAAIGPVPSYQGVKSTGSYDGSPTNMRLVVKDWDPAKKRIKLQNEVTNAPNDGRQEFYQVETQSYLSRAEFEDTWHDATMPILVHYFWANPGDTQKQRDQYRMGFSYFITD